MGGTQIRLPVGGGLSPSGVARGGQSCRATWRKASKRKSRTPSPRVADWTRVAAQMRWVVPEVRRHSTSWSSPRRCCRTAYRCGVVSGVGFGRRGGWWCGV